jgi:hypothetical protein
MNELKMYVSQNPDLFLDVFHPASPTELLIKRDPAEQVLLGLPDMLSSQGSLTVKCFQRQIMPGANRSFDTPVKDFQLSNSSTPEAKPQNTPHKSDMAETNLSAELLIIQNENKWLRESHSKLEKENSELRVHNEKLRIDNNDLSVKNSVAEKEKQLALQQQEVLNKPKGLSGFAEPEAFKELIAGVTTAIKAWKGDNNPGQPQLGAETSGLSKAKQEFIQFVQGKISSGVTDEQSQRLAFLIRTIVDKRKIDFLFEQWSQSNNSTNHQQIEE